MNVLSLFDGLSCGQIALNRIGIKYDNYYGSEIDPFAMKVTKSNYPNTQHIGDVRFVNSENLPNIDLLFGGSPCTQFSFAGRAVGMITSDNIEITDLETYLRLKEEGFEFIGQSYLFWEYVRILKEVKPKYFLLENVRMSEKWENVISDTLGVKPLKIDSRLLTAQKRRRLYWTNIPNVTIPEDKGVLLKDILLDRTDPLFTLEVPSEKRIKYMEGRAKRGFLSKMYITKDTEKAECIVASVYKNMKEFVYKDENGVRFLTDIELERLQTVPDNYTNYVSKTQRKKMLGNGWTVDVIAHIFSFLPKDFEN